MTGGGSCSTLSLAESDGSGLELMHRDALIQDLTPALYASQLVLAEIAVRHHLAALYQPVFIWTVVRDRVVDRADVLPHQHVALFPVRRVDVFRLELVPEEELEHLVALLLR